VIGREKLDWGGTGARRKSREWWSPVSKTTAIGCGRRLIVAQAEEMGKLRSEILEDLMCD